MPVTISGGVDTVIVSQTLATLVSGLSVSDSGSGYGVANARKDNVNATAHANIFRLDFGTSATVPTNLCVNNRAANYILYATGLGTDY